ncbi:MAG TPA: hypothetical protein VFB79_22025, partial [Candidatus Angelobacter sp.]|nr:hypothetical protein [Candidatus Angelobacter sp.]
MQEKVYLPYSQVHGVKPDLMKLREALSLQDRATMLRILSVLNFSLNHLLTDPSEEAQKAAIRRFFPLALASEILRRDDVVFHRHQLLFLIQEAFVYCPDINPSEQNATSLTQLGDIFLIANDLLFTPAPGTNANDSGILQLILNFVPISEANLLTNPLLKMGRSHLLVTKFAERRRGTAGFFDIPFLFQQATGVEFKTFEALMAVIFTRLANVAQAKKDPTQFGFSVTYFDQLPIGKGEISSFLQIVGASPDEFASNLKAYPPQPNDFRFVRDKPLVHITDHFFPLDPPSGVEKFESGVFWSIFKSMNPHERNPFSSFWGHIFEDYALWLLEQSCIPPLNHLYKNPKYVQDLNHEVCDAIVVCGRIAVFLEMKGSTIASDAKYGSDINKLRDEIEKKYVGLGNDRKGVRQLVAAIDTFLKGGRTAEIQDVDLRSISTIIPVLVTRDDFGGYFGVNAYLNRRFKEIRNASRHQVSVTSCVCINSDTLEKLTPYLADTSFADILSSRLRNDKALCAPFFARVGQILKQKNKGESDREPLLLKAAAYTISDVAREVFGI